MNRLFAGTDALPDGRSIAFVFAHPDDETYATGASIAKYAAEGVRCSLYCATDGDAKMLDWFEAGPQPVQIGIDARHWNATKRAAFAAHVTQQQHRKSFERDAMTERESYFVMTGMPVAPGASDLFAAP